MAAPTAQRCDAVVLFGATGDLARRKLFPALYELARAGRLPPAVVGVSRSDWTAQDLADRARQGVREFGPAEPDEAALSRLAAAVDYVPGDYGEPATYQRLRTALGSAQRPLLYLAVPPGLFEPVVANLAAAGLAEHARVVVEKPFGRDLESARALDRCVLQRFGEQAVFRIDHFLGKEEVLDLLVLRFANTILEPTWNRHHIASVQITMAEDLGIAGRGAFYDRVGAVRDVLQNHLLQLLTLVAMEPPAGSDAQALRDEKVKVLRALPAIDPADVVRGQVTGYRDESGVAADSQTETFVALRAEIDSWRWAGVPFYIRAGKNLATTATEVLVEYRRPPQQLFARADAPPPHPNHLRFRVKPGEQVSMTVQVKQPGEQMISRPVDLSYSYDDRRDGRREDAYARLLDDALDGDQRLFARTDGIEQAWRIVDPLLHDPAPAHPYEPGSWGPPQAATLIAADGGWHDPDHRDR